MTRHSIGKHVTHGQISRGTAWGKVLELRIPLIAVGVLSYYAWICFAYESPQEARVDSCVPPLI